MWGNRRGSSWCALWSQMDLASVLPQPLLCDRDRRLTFPESSCPLQGSWRHPHRRKLVGHARWWPHQVCHTAARVAGHLHSSFSKALHWQRTAHWGPSRGEMPRKLVETFLGSWLPITRRKFRNNGRHSFGSLYYLNQPSSLAEKAIQPTPHSLGPSKAKVAKDQVLTT